MPTGARRRGWIRPRPPRPQATCSNASLNRTSICLLDNAYGSAAARLDPPEAAKAANDLRERLAKPGPDPSVELALIYAYGSAAARLDPSDAAKAASDLRERLGKSDLDRSTKQALSTAYGRAVARLDPPEAAKAVSV